MSTLSIKEKRALKLFSERLHQNFSGKVHAIQLFGSKARGDATKFSDVDVLVILDQATWQDRHIVSRLTSRILLETGVMLSPKTFSQEQFEQIKQRRSMFWQSIAPDLVPIE